MAEGRTGGCWGRSPAVREASRIVDLVTRAGREDEIRACRLRGRALYCMVHSLPEKRETPRHWTGGFRKEAGSRGNQPPTR